MFELLTRILLWILIGTIVWYVFQSFIPREYLTWLGGLLIFVFVILAFFEPENTTTSLVWSILSLPLKPLGLSIILLITALKKGVKGVVGNQVLVALLILLVSSTPVIAYWLTDQTERSATQQVELQNQQQQPEVTPLRAIVVLGDGTDTADPAYRARTQVNNPQDGYGVGLISRLLRAADIYQSQAQQGNQPLVIITSLPRNVEQQDSDGTPFATIQQVLINAGVPQDRIDIDTTGINVRTSARVISDRLQNEGYNPQTERIALVAPALIIRRAASSFANRGVAVVSAPTDYFAFQLDENRALALLADLTPNVEALALTTRVIDEYLVSIYYFLRGWLMSPLAL